jgi:hypothetical protein
MSPFCCKILAIGTLFLIPAVGLVAQDPPSPVDLAQILKPILIKSMPAVLYEQKDNWGHQAMIPVGLKWSGGKPTIQRSLRNHGVWKQLVITAQELPRTLEVKISDVKKVDAEKQTFKVFFTFQMGVDYDQQTWENGVRLWSGGVRARAQVHMNMECENTLRVELSKELLPDFILRIRVTKADVHYDDLVVEHINGIGGSGAKLVGMAVHDCMKQWRPSIERDLLDRVGAAVVKTADTKEIRFGFSSLMKKG